MADLIERAARVTPSPRQLAWQELEFIAFIHFTVNAFTDKEWGDGNEDPAIFDPAQFDARQWVRAVKSAGMRMILLTAKHHDGFCLWPSRYTEHSVKSSPWKNGKGDIVREVSEACREGGIKFGVYLSPWDRHEPTYGDSPAYNEHFKNQLRELLTNYGPIAEVWFDGACGEGPNGKRQVYDWDGYYQVIRELQPDAVIAIRGPDVRWCGNEAGNVRKSEWSVIPIPAGGDPLRTDLMAEDLGSREKLKEAERFIWYPAEVNTSIRPGWFYHASDDLRVKSLEHLLEIYYGSVGGNGVFLLNLPPDPRGLIHENDVERLRELGEVLRATFERDLAKDAAARASHVRGNDPAFGPDKIADGDKNTYWTTDDGVTAATVEFDLGEERSFNCATLQERIQVGQRVEDFALDAWDGRNWRELVRSTTIGYKRLLRFGEVTARKVRVRILQSRLCPTLSNFGLFQAPLIVSPPRIRRDKQGMVTIACRTPGPPIHYTLDGSDPTAASARYTEPIALPDGGLVRAKVFDPVTGKASAPCEAEFDICKGKWRVVHFDSEERGEEAANAVDDDPATIWITDWRTTKDPHPHEIQIDLGETVDLEGFTYLPRQDLTGGIILDYEFYVSRDGKNWGEPASEGSFSNVLNNPVQQTVRFEKPITGRFIRLVGLSEVKGAPWTSVAELGVLTERGRKARKRVSGQ
jgi:alpha-L-fucosidase